jgi:UDP-glucose 4-epimerase
VSFHVNRWTLLANDLCRQAVEKESITLRSNGCQYRDFICLTDVEELMAKMIMSARLPQQVVYNVGSGISMRVIDMADAVIQTAVTVLKKNISLNLPTGALPTDEITLNYSVSRLLAEGYSVPNDVNIELERLLQFCAKNFALG